MEDGLPYEIRPLQVRGHALWTFQHTSQFSRLHQQKILAEKLDIFVVVYLDDILIYIEDPGQPDVNPVQWILEQLQKHGLYANLKKCRYHENEVRFLGYVVSAQGIRIEEKKIKAVKIWPESQSVRDI